MITIKRKHSNWFYYYYLDSKTNLLIYHGLYDDYSFYGIGYHYHSINKGFWLLYKDRI